MERRLDAREYKLLLDPAAVDAPSREAANRFWTQRLEPAIAARLGPRSDGRKRTSGAFKPPVERIVRYWDTQDGILTRAELCLRTRLPAREAKSKSPRPKITLKLRTTDYFVVADAWLPSAGGNGRQKFEEDIAPLQVGPAGAADEVVLPARRSVRSRYARSSDQFAPWPLPSPSLSDIISLYPTVLTSLGDPPADVTSMRLHCGPRVQEFAFDGPTVRLGDGITGEFTLTLWHLDSNAVASSVAEISFKCATIDGAMSGKAAGRALSLFEGFQTDLGDCINLAFSSKTALALPASCRQLA